MSVFLLFLIVLTSVCFSTIFLMEQKPEEVKSTNHKQPSTSSKNNPLVMGTVKDPILQDSNSI